MDIVLKKPIEELTPQMIEFNNAELLAYVKEFLQPYKEMKFNDDNIAEAKETTATLNKMSKRLNDWRLEVGSVYLEPYNKFKQQVDEVKAEIDGTTAEIKKIVTDYTENKKTEKRNKIEELYKQYFGKLTNIVSLDLIFNAKWLNGGYKLPIIEQDLMTIRTKVDKDLENINTLVDEADRADFLIEYSKSLDFGCCLSELKRKKERKAYLDSLANEKPKNIDYSPETPKAVNTTEQTTKTAATTEQEPEKVFEDVTEKAFTVTFEMKLTKSQAFALKGFLDMQKITYKKL